MKRSLYFSLVFLTSALAPLLSHAQPYLYNHLYWEAKGERSNQKWGLSGLSYIGRLNDTIQHAVAIGEITGSFTGDVRRGVAGLAFNRDSHGHDTAL